jgi:hypothetical protein
MCRSVFPNAITVEDAAALCGAPQSKKAQSEEK